MKPLSKLLGACLLSVSLFAEDVELTTDQTLAAAEGWTFECGDWSLTNGTLTQSNPRGAGRAFHHPVILGDVSLRVRFRAHDDGTGVKAAGLILRSSDSRCAYFVHYDTKNDQIILTRGGVGRDRKEITRRTKVRIDTGHWYAARTDVIGPAINIYLNDALIISARDDALTCGLVGVYTSQGRVDFEDIRISGKTAALDREWRVRMSYEVPQNHKTAGILSTDVICKQPGRYIGWPTILRKRDGELLVVFSGDRDEHVCPWGKVQMVRSRDEGKTWSPPETICNTPLDDRDAGIIETKSGTLVVAWFTSLAFEKSMRSSWLRGKLSPDVLDQWRHHAEKLTPEIRDEWLGYWTRRSQDNGTTWDAPVRTTGSAPHGPIELSDGRLLFVGRRSPHRKTELTVEESRDDGRSWQQIASIQTAPEDDPNQFHEPHVVETSDGKLVSLFRYHYVAKGAKKRDDRESLLRQSESVDGGKTWTVAKATGLLGYPPHLIRLKDGTLLCVYGRRIPPYGEYACVSRDGGTTWDTENEIKLASAINGDLGYPASAQLEDGSILTVYYQIHKEGEKTCLMGTHWRLK